MYKNLWESINSRQRLTLISGPCVVESEELCLTVAGQMKEICDELGVLYIFKASYDKANRTSGLSFRGPGADEGLRILGKVREKLGIPVLTDIHSEIEARRASNWVDVLQIPAFLCRQTDIIAEAVKTGKIVNIKKGQFLSPLEMKQVIAKAKSFGGEKIMATERGSSFGYNNLVVDMRGLAIMKEFGAPIVFDATHSVQLPGGGGDKSSGERKFAPVLARCAIVAGVDGIFAETHPNPDKALSDGPNMIRLDDMPEFLRSLLRVRNALKEEKPELTLLH
jgi:2-dehydro-3-deoxyphosphooctonate aldolase (KDO 8-P synthase)